ncbi:MAG: enoyl-CoA hydratase [Actinomycetia bacterium]|nr:enoyl-CoA hydratase [Actinomycetes bacterium]MCP3912045.1 enoyl-CoA hydratase [Actinomycetes bacterium]MCP4086760.1 enoyl-CoA hydratase [Actinomycetes bacterium]
MAAVDTGTEDLLADLTDGVGTLTLNRPQARNAMSDGMNQGLAGMLDAWELDPDVRCIVLTGGGGAFCAGGDVKGMAASGGEGRVPNWDERVHKQRLNQRGTSGRLFRMPKPTIAKIPGATAGAGMGLALACDLKVAAEGAVFTTAFTRVGFAGDYGGTWFLTQLVGPAKAKELYYLSDRLSGAELAELGIVNKAVPADELDAAVDEWAARIAAGPTIAYRYQKENINRALIEDLEMCMDLEATHHLRTGQTDDHLAAAQAFAEKRDPVFKGR